MSKSGVAPVLLLGALIWAGATIALRIGNVAFFGGSLALQAAAYLAALPVLAALILVLSRQSQRLSPLEIAAALAIPGMVLDMAVVHLWTDIFPNLPRRPDLFGALMLWWYATAIAIGLFLSRDRSTKSRQAR